MNTEKEIVAQILAGDVSKSGLRFDRVVQDVLGALRLQAGQCVPDGKAVLVSISAPVKLPGKTKVALLEEMVAMLGDGKARRLRIQGNEVQMRLAASRRALKLAGFVHAAHVPAGQFLDRAEIWLAAST